MIGFYDSGVGGLTILEQVLNLEPDFPFIYLADTEILPLGDKPVDFIQSRVKSACAHLFEMGCEIVVLSCNTASVNCIRHIQQVWLPANFPNKQVLSITKPLTELIEEKYQHLKLEKGLLLSTIATHNSGFYQYELIKSGFLNIKSLPCKGLAEAIENNDSITIQYLTSSYLAQNSTNPNDIQFIALACTHYKWAMIELTKIFPNATIIEPSVRVSVRLLEYIKRHPEYNITSNEPQKILATGQTESIKKMLQKIDLEYFVDRYELS